MLQLTRQIDHVGLLLETGFKECSEDPCENGGSCTDHSSAGGATCRCVDGYTGQFCECTCITLAYIHSTLLKYPHYIMFN